MPDEQLGVSCADDSTTLQSALARGPVLQIDQAELEHQSILRNIGQRCTNANLDRHRRVCVGRDNQEGTACHAEPRKNVASSQICFIRENGQL